MERQVLEHLFILIAYCFGGMASSLMQDQSPHFELSTRGVRPPLERAPGLPPGNRHRRDIYRDCTPEMRFRFYHEATMDNIMVFTATFAATPPEIMYFGWLTNNKYVYIYIDGRGQVDRLNGVVASVSLRQSSGMMSTSLMINTYQLPQSKSRHLIGLSMQLFNHIICAEEMYVAGFSLPLDTENLAVARLENTGFESSTSYCPFTIGMEIKVIVLSTVTVCRCTFQADVEEVTYLGWVVRGRYMLLYSDDQNTLEKKVIDNGKVYYEKLSSHHNQTTSLVVMKRVDEDIKLSLALSDGRLCLVTAMIVDYSTDRDDHPTQAMFSNAVGMTKIHFGYALLGSLLIRY